MRSLDTDMPSTVIRYFRYDAAKRELDVTFVTGRRYIYEDVPPQLADAFRSAFSKGTFFNVEIRDRYAFREVTPERAGPVDLFKR